MTIRILAKRVIQACAIALAFLPAAFSAFGRLHGVYTLFAHAYALVPGSPGNFLRAAFYKLTLRASSIDVTISFGSLFSQTGVTLGPNVSIGCYCVIGNATIGARTQIASHVEIPSGAREHHRATDGKLGGLVSGGGAIIGADCWIGASAVILAEVGAGSTIGAGAVVVKPIPPGSTAVGNPAKVISPATFTADAGSA